MMKLGQSKCKGLSPKEWKAYQKSIRQDHLQIWAMFINKNPDYDYHYECFTIGY